MLSLPTRAVGLFALLSPLTFAQSNSGNNQDQEELCTDACIVSATCNNQCILEPKGKTSMLQAHRYIFTL